MRHLGRANNDNVLAAGNDLLDSRSQESPFRHGRLVNDAKYAIESDVRLSVEESRINRALARQKDEEIDRLNAEIERLKKEFSDSDRRVADAESRGTAAAERAESTIRKSNEERAAALSEMRNELDRAARSKADDVQKITHMEQELRHAQREAQAAQDMISALQAKVPEQQPLDEKALEEKVHEMNEKEVAILEFVGNDPSSSSAYIAERIGMSRLEVEFYTEELRQAGFLEFEYGQNEVELYSITQLGRRLVMLAKRSGLHNNSLRT